METNSTIEAPEVESTEVTESVFTVEVVAYVKITQTIELLAASEEDAIGDAFDIALANASDWKVAQSIETLTEHQLSVDSIEESDDDSEEEGDSEEE